MSSQEKSFERVNQKQRTRAELLRAAGELAEKGLQPSVADVADHAGISRATAYRYFSKPENMLREAALDAIARAIQPHVDRLAKDSKDAPNAVEHLVKQVFDMVSENEAMFRTFLANSVTGNDVKRGGRRLTWLSDVLAPLKDRIAKPDYDRLLYSLSLLTGIETLVVLKDVCGLDSKKAEDVTLWAAKTLLAGVLGKERSE
jgi:AcrR family transcriptional regulator